MAHLDKIAVLEGAFFTYASFVEARAVAATQIADRVSAIGECNHGMSAGNRRGRKNDIILRPFSDQRLRLGYFALDLAAVALKNMQYGFDWRGQCIVFCLILGRYHNGLGRVLDSRLKLLAGGSRLSVLRF